MTRREGARKWWVRGVGGTREGKVAAETLARDDACAEDCCFRRTAKKRSFIYDRQLRNARPLRLFNLLVCL